MSEETGIRTQKAAVGAGAIRRGEIWEKRVVGSIWHFFTSVRLALILILIIALAVLAGTLLDQAPAATWAAADLRAQWLSNAHDKYGWWANLFDPFDNRFFSLFAIFHSFWFRLLIGLLVVNIVVCTMNRWKGIWSTAFPKRIKMSDSFFQHARFNAAYVTAMPHAKALDSLTRALKRSGYRVKVQKEEGSAAVYADRNRFSRFGTILSHLAIVLLLAGVVVGTVLGKNPGDIVIAQGATEAVPGTDISVQLVTFTDKYDPITGLPSEYRSEIIIYDHGQEVKHGETSVNSPLSYHGYQFFQSFYGNAERVRVTDADGNSLSDSPVPLAYQSYQGRPIGMIALPGQNLTAYVEGPSGGDDAEIEAGQARVSVYQGETGPLVGEQTLTQGEEPVQVAGLTFQFVEEVRFTGLKVSKTPGVNIIWVASALMILGLVILFYFPHRRLWASCKDAGGGRSEVKLGMSAQRDVQLTTEFKRVRERVESALRRRDTGRQASRHASEGEPDVHV